MNLDKIKDEVFPIAGIDFKLKEDLELDESEEASKLLSLFFLPKTATVVAHASSNDVKKFLSIVLKPADGSKLPEGFSFGRITESVQTKVFLFFFIGRIRSGMNIATETADLMNELAKP